MSITRYSETPLNQTPSGPDKMLCLEKDSGFKASFIHV